MRKVIYVMLVLLIGGIASVNAQVTIGSSKNPHEGAVLELVSASTQGQGLLLPNVSLESVSTLQVATDDSANKFSAIGMLVYNINPLIADGKGTGVYIWDGNKWVVLISTQD